MNTVRKMHLTFAILATAAWLAVTVPPAAHAASPPAWGLKAVADTVAEPGGELSFSIFVRNEGETATSPGSCPGAGCQELSVALPAGLEALEARAESGDWECTVGGPQAVDCVAPAAVPPRLSPGAQPNFPHVVLRTHVATAASGNQVTHFEVSGGGATRASIEESTLVSTLPLAFGIESFRALAEGPSGAPDRRAGAHPFALLTDIHLNRSLDARHGELWPPAPLRDSVVDLPPGLIGDASITPRCNASQLAHSKQFNAEPECPPGSQVGLIDLGTKAGNLGATSTGVAQNWLTAVYNIIPPKGVPAAFGFQVDGSVVTLLASVRSESDYGVSVGAVNAPEAEAILATDFTFWGEPSSHSHDYYRSCPGTTPRGFEGPACAAEGEPGGVFLRNSTSCAEASRTTVKADSWKEPGVFSTASSEGPPLEGCQDVPFEPSMTVRPTTDQADSPTGLNVDLAMPQQCWHAGEIESICQADVKDTRVTQPVGTRINPATADGLTGCSEAQIGFIGGGFPMPNPTHFTAAPPTCPDSSKIGTVEIESPLLPDKLEGSIYQAKQDENPFGSTLAFYAVASADGVMIKLPAEVLSDPRTGQVTTVFRDSPQLPFEHYKLHFFGGSRAPLITPPTCGTKTTHSTLTGWANPGSPVHLEDSFQITSGAGGSPCPASESGRPFAPSFEAGTTSPVAGAFSPFVLKVGRADGMQELQTITTTMPEGLLGKLAGVSYCPESAIAAASSARGLAERAEPSCPAASQIGVAQATAGAGPTPFDNPGKVYLTGPYKGAPLSLVIVTPAVAGPLDLGTVVVRSALQVDPQTTQIHVVSDPIPASITEGGDGFPLDVRQVIVQIDRPDFTLNPTSCEPSAVTGTIGAVQGASANVSDRFQVGGCEHLAFKPRLSLRLKGRTRRAGHPALRATLTMPGANQTNIARTTVSLPRTEFLAQGHLGDVCTRVQYAEGGGGGGGCPKRSVYGHARAWSPLLAAPLEGNVYLRSNGGERKLPDLVASLNGQIHVDLLGYVSSNPKTHGLRTSFATVPDAPVSKFVLTMPAGRHSLLENTTNICHATNRAIVQMDAQNGKISDSRPRLKVAGCRSHKKHHRRHKSKG